MGEENLLYKNKFRIPSARLAGWNYADYGFYFVTICTKNREKFFGDIINGKMNLSEIGTEVEKGWEETKKIRKYILLDEYIIMPNHIHGIIKIKYNVTNVVRGEYKNKFGPQFKNLSAIIRGFKGQTTKKIHLLGYKDFGWQERFYDRVIRNSEELNRIRQYIIDNPIKWHLDRNNPDSII